MIHYPRYQIFISGSFASVPTNLDPGLVNRLEPDSAVFNLQRMHWYFDLQRLFSRQAHRSREACNMRDIAATCRTFPLLEQLATGFFFVPLVEFPDTDVAELMITRPNSYRKWLAVSKGNIPGARVDGAYMQSHSLISHSLHIFGFDGSNAGSVVTPFSLSIALTGMTLSKSPPSTRLSTCSSTTKNGILASMYPIASIGGGGGTMCVTCSQLAGSRMWTWTRRVDSVFQVCAGLGSRYMSWTREGSVYHADGVQGQFVASNPSEYGDFSEYKIT